METKQESKKKVDGLIIDMFNNACEIFVQEGHKDNEYAFCENTIKTTLNYFKTKRESDKEKR